MNGPRWIKQWIGELAVLNEQFRDEDGSVDFEALGREEYAFRVALITGHTKKSERARLALELAEKAYRASVENGKKGGRPAKTTADAPTREDGEFKSDSGDAGNLESATSANHYGVAPHSEAGDVSATDSNISQDAPNGNAVDESLVHPAPNMRRVPQNEAPAHGFSGGRTAQGTMSRSPEAAAQSGKAYDQETDQVSTGEAQQSQARESRRTGGSSVRGMAKVAQPPVRSSGPMPANVQKVYDFASLEGLDKDDAYECWYVTTAERDGNDADGNPVTNWKAFVRTWCNTRSKKRSA